MTALFKRTIRSSVIPGLIDVLQKISHRDQYTLLKKLEKIHSELKRKHYRKTISSEVECYTKYGLNRGRITNISANGVFIETRMPFHCGEDIKLKFIFPQIPQNQLQISGQIIRITPDGVGVQFKNQSKEQEILIASYLEVS
jgi:Tfp pilus assembly protein PilZ